MSDQESRIDQFRKMAEADPTNELGHFSLGRACLDAGMNEQAIAPLERVIELNPNISKAYQLLGTALMKLNRRDDAVARLTQGIQVASARGDMLPRSEMAELLKQLGAPVPELAQPKTPERPLGEGEVVCNRCGRTGRKLSSPPFSNAQGREIFEKICADCWREWIGMGTKVINELRLPLSDPQAQKIFDQHMLEFLNLQK